MRCSSNDNIMKKFKKFIKNIAIALISIMAVVLPAGVCWTIDQYSPESRTLELTNSFDVVLEEARDLMRSIPYETTYMLLHGGPYEDCEIIKYFQGPVVGYSITDDGLKIVVGNSDGSKSAAAFISGAYEIQEIEKTYHYGKYVATPPSTEAQYAIQFSMEGLSHKETYILDENLNVWKINN